MANNPTPPMIPLSPVWVNLYAASGLTVGDPLLLFCRGRVQIFVAEAAAQPADDFEGISITPNEMFVVDRGSIGLWGRTMQASSGSGVIVQFDPKG